MIDSKLIARINELSAISKQRELTESEKIEQKELRKKYLEQFSKGFRQSLDNVKVIDPNGKDITPKKKGNA